MLSLLLDEELENSQLCQNKTQSLKFNRLNITTSTIPLVNKLNFRFDFSVECLARSDYHFCKDATLAKSMFSLILDHSEPNSQLLPAIAQDSALESG